jgi:hypothetical protein
MRSLYDKAFTDYGGQIGYAPAVATIAVALILCGGLIYGGINIGKSAFAKPLAKKAAIVIIHHA